MGPADFFLIFCIFLSANQIVTDWQLILAKSGTEADGAESEFRIASFTLNSTANGNVDI